MAEQRKLLEIAEAKNDLLADSDDLNTSHLEEEFNEENIQEVEGIIAEAQLQNPAENEDSLDDFTDTITTSRHANANEEKLNFYADANHKDTTKQQTKWAVNLFTGNYELFTEIYLIFQEIKSCSRR